MYNYVTSHTNASNELGGGLLVNGCVITLQSVVWSTYSIKTAEKLLICIRPSTVFMRRPGTDPLKDTVDRPPFHQVATPQFPNS